MPYQGSLFGVLKLADGDWLAYGMRGNVLRSTDQGDTWTHIDSRVGTSYFGAVQLADGELVLVGQGGAIVTSRDNGQSFAVRKVGGVQSLAAVVDAGHGELALGGEAGMALLPVSPAVRPLGPPLGFARLRLRRPARHRPELRGILFADIP